MDLANSSTAAPFDKEDTEDIYQYWITLVSLVISYTFSKIFIVQVMMSVNKLTKFCYTSILVIAVTEVLFDLLLYMETPWIRSFVIFVIISNLILSFCLYVQYDKEALIRLTCCKTTEVETLVPLLQKMSLEDDSDISFDEARLEFQF